jgi:hypothetical protein
VEQRCPALLQWPAAFAQRLLNINVVFKFDSEFNMALGFISEETTNPPISG